MPIANVWFRMEGEYPEDFDNTLRPLAGAGLSGFYVDDAGFSVFSDQYHLGHYSQSRGCYSGFSAGGAV